MNSSSPVAPTLAVHLAKCLVQLLLKCTAPMSLIPSSWSSVGMRVAGALLESAMLLTIVLTAFLVAEVAAAAAAADAAAAAGSAIRSCCSTIEGVQSQSVPQAPAVPWQGQLEWSVCVSGELNPTGTG